MKPDKKIRAVFIFLFLANFFVWSGIIFNSSENENPEIYFLSVGQGDAELIILPNGTKILIDGGPGKSVISALDEVLSVFDRYIDVLIVSHPEADHFSGLIEAAKRYGVGVFVWSGRQSSNDAFNDLAGELRDKGVKSVSVLRGDKIRSGNSLLEVLSPSRKVLSASSANESSLVLKFLGGGGSALFTGDIGFYAEKEILDNQPFGEIDVLKVAHHGSKNSSGGEFLKYVSPKIAVIEVGKNSYGHPTGEVLERLASVSAQVFRTDKDGSVKIIFKDGRIEVLKKGVSF